MTSFYPGVLDEPANDKAFGTSMTDHPQHHNDLADAIRSTQGTLGINPQGSYNSVVDRLDDLTGARFVTIAKWSTD